LAIGKIQKTEYRGNLTFCGWVIASREFSFFFFFLSLNHLRSNSKFLDAGQFGLPMAITALSMTNHNLFLMVLMDKIPIAQLTRIGGSDREMGRKSEAKLSGSWWDSSHFGSYPRDEFLRANVN